MGDIDYIRIIEEKYNRIYSFCLRAVGNSESARDITQDTFLVFWQKRSSLSFKTEDQFMIWLYKTAKNKISEHYKEVVKSNNVTDISECNAAYTFAASWDMPLSPETVDEEIEKQRDYILTSLSPDEYLLYDMIYVQKKKYSDIAKELDITLDKVKKSAVKLKKTLNALKNIVFNIIKFIFS